MQGSIQKRAGKHGVSWRVRYDVAQPDGSRKQVSETAPTKREAEALLAKRLHELQTGAYVAPTDLTVGELLDRWFATHAERVCAATLHRYRRAAHTHILPTIGAVKLVRLTTLGVQDFYLGVQAKGITAEGVRAVHKVLHGALKQAVAWQIIARNPADGVSMPRPVRRELTVWDAPQTAARNAAVECEPTWGAFFRLAIHTGMRRGELLALRWSDLDLDRGYATVRRTMTEDDAGKPVIGTGAKTNAARRTIALSASCVDTLRRQRAKQAERRLRLGPIWNAADGDVIFDRGDGSPLHPDSIKNALDRYAKKAGVPRIRVHDLRHTMATLGLTEGLHPKIVQERLGHSSIAMTLDRYSHVSPELQRDGAARLDAALDRALRDNLDATASGHVREEHKTAG